MAGAAKLLETIGALLPKGIKAWHASPHDFDKFDMSKIGTGQGAQSYGHGIYAAESPAVSGVGGEYWKEFTERRLKDFNRPFWEVDAEKLAIEAMKKNKFDRNAATDDLTKSIDFLRENIGSVKAHPRDLKEADKLSEAVDLLQSGKPVGARVYELNIKAEPDAFLQWDKPLKEQQHLLPRLYEAGITPKSLDTKTLEAMPGDWPKMQAEYIQDVGRKTGSDIAPQSAETAARFRDVGIPGTRYLDQGSRRIPNEIEIIRKSVARLEREGLADSPQYKNLANHLRALEARPLTSNYVMFNPDIIEIMRKLAIPGMVGGGAAASVYQPQGSQ